MWIDGELRIWPYGVALSYALAALVAITLIMTRFTRRVKAGKALGALACAVTTGLIGARLVWCAIHYSEYIFGNPARIVQIGDGGLSLWGGLMFAIGALALYCWQAKVRLGAMLDALTPGLLVMVAIMRWAEPLAGQGIGKVMQAAWLNLPFLAVTDEYDFARFAVWRYEAAAAIFVALMTLMRRKEEQPAGKMFVTAVSEIAALQLVFESLRDDDYLHISFVRVSQILAAIILLGMLINELRLSGRQGKGVKGLGLIAMFIAGGAIVVKQEFAVDSLAYLELNYVIMLLGALITRQSVYLAQRMHEKACRGRKRRREKRRIR